MTDDQVRRLNAELGLPPASAERWLHDLRADERRERADRIRRATADSLARYPGITAALHKLELAEKCS